MVQVGSVIRFTLDHTNPPKIKWIIIVGIATDEYAYVVINTEPRYDSPGAVPVGLQGSQLPISAKDCPFLDHDSHVNCSELKEQKKKIIDAHCKANPKEHHKGYMPKPQLRSVQELIKKAKTLEPVLKKKYGLSFDSGGPATAQPTGSL